MLQHTLSSISKQNACQKGHFSGITILSPCMGVLPSRATRAMLTSEAVMNKTKMWF